MGCSGKQFRALMLVGSSQQGIPAADGILRAWGNSQTQGYGLPGCNSLTCHPDGAWPALFAAGMGWTIDNQAFGSSDCADLTYQGTSQSLWDEVVTPHARNVYAHFRNDQVQYGPMAYRMEYARGCIEAQIAWLGLPETAKARGASGFQSRTGTWQAVYNSAAAQTVTRGATLTFQTTGTTAYLVAARHAGAAPASYTVSVDGSAVYDAGSGSSTFSQSLDIGRAGGFPVSEAVLPFLIRVPGLQSGTHTLTYTCTAPTATDPCVVFFAASPALASGALVYSLSPVDNAAHAQAGYATSAVTSLYANTWVSLLNELNADGLDVVGIDATDPSVYNAETQSQADGVHESAKGHASIAQAAIRLAKAAEQR